MLYNQKTPPQQRREIGSEDPQDGMKRCNEILQAHTNVNTKLYSVQLRYWIHTKQEGSSQEQMEEVQAEDKPKQECTLSS